MEISDIFPNDIPRDKINEFRKNMEDVQRIMIYYSCALLEIETKFNVLNKQFSLEQEHNPIDTIKTRIKSTESIVEKLHRKGLPLNIASAQEHLNDVAGIRVICPFINDIYLLSDCLLAQDDVRLIQKKDYIENPKPNGYRSLHLIVETPIFLQNEKKLMKVEVQLRTIAMDFWANLEHRMRYKKELDPQILDLLSGELKECADASASLDLRMERVKNTIEEKAR